MFDTDYTSIPVDSEVLLSDEPSELTKEHIRQQFQHPNNMRFDYVSTFIETYNYTMMKITDEDVIGEIESVTDSFIQFMINILVKYYNVGFPTIGDKSTDNQLEMLHMVYRYFVLNMKHNITSYCWNYIKKHRDELFDEFPERKDVLSASLLSDGISVADVALIANLYNIINMILGKECDVDEFLAHSDNNEPRLETEEMIEYYDQFELVGNFTETYMEQAQSDASFIKEVEAKIRNKILKPYKKSFKKVVPSESNTLADEDQQ